jgi:hypothetical protein
LKVRMSMLWPSYFLMMLAVSLSVLKEFMSTKGTLTSYVRLRNSIWRTDRSRGEEEEDVERREEEEEVEVREHQSGRGEEKEEEEDKQERGVVHPDQVVILDVAGAGGGFLLPVKGHTLPDWFWMLWRCSTSSLLEAYTSRKRRDWECVIEVLMFDGERSGVEWTNIVPPIISPTGAPLPRRHGRGGFQEALVVVVAPVERRVC